MATLREEIEQSAFWHGQTCVRCGSTTEEEASETAALNPQLAPDECAECGGKLVDSRELLELIQRSDPDDAAGAAG